FRGQFEGSGVEGGAVLEVPIDAKLDDRSGPDLDRRDFAGPPGPKVVGDLAGVGAEPFARIGIALKEAGLAFTGLVEPQFVVRLRRLRACWRVQLGECRRGGSGNN